MLLGLDLGTTHVKAGVGLCDGRIVGQCSVPVRLINAGTDGVEQDLNEIWSVVIVAIQRAVRGLDASRIRAVGVSSQGGAMQILDHRNKPLGRVISWMDGRGHDNDEQFLRKVGTRWLAQHIGRRRSGLAIGQLLRLRRENRALLEPPNRIGFVGDIIVGRLCGRAAHDGTSCGLTLLYNPCLRSYDPDLLRLLKIHESQLPAIQPTGQAAGGLLPEVARRTGLAVGIPVSCAVHDQYAASLGSGVIRPGDVMFGAGTAWVLLALTSRLPKPVTEDAFVCHHVMEGLYGQILSLRTGGSAVNWAKQLLGWAQLPDAALDEKIGSVSPGSDGLHFQPFGPACGASETSAPQGRLSGLRLCHGREHVLRAVIEGLAFELDRHLGFLTKTGIAVRRLVMCGGAAQSRVTPHVIADVTDLPVACSAVSEGSVLGALIIALGLLQSRTSPDRLLAQMVPKTKVIKPGADSIFYRNWKVDRRRLLTNTLRAGGVHRA